MRLAFVLLIFWNIVLIGQQDWMKEYDFVYLDEYLEEAIYEVRYFSTDNFVGDTISGYHSDRPVITRSAAQALRKIEKDLLAQGYCLKVFDTYRPQRAVDHFKQWAGVINDTIMKSQYYPDQDKRRLFALGYIASRSGHSRGSTIDLTIAHLDTGEEVDMGSPYDFFGEISHHAAVGLTQEQASNRMLLKTAMQTHGFRSYSKEWWHYTLNGEPYSDRYFDFVVGDQER